MKVIKILGALVLFIILVITSYLLYFSRSQTIDFSTMLGNEVEVCNQTIGKKHNKYIQLKNWLNTNQTGWENYPATQAVGYIYSSKDLVINVGNGSVVINYGELANRTQVFIKADTKSINGKCI